MRLRVILMSAILVVWLLLPTGLLAVGPTVQQLQLELAALYERLHDWDKAEAQFLAAAEGPSKALRQQAFEGIERVRKLAEESDDNSSLKLGEFYERQEMWSEAEQHYLAAAKDGPEGARRLALEGLQRVRDQIPRSRWTEDVQPIREGFDFFSGLISRLLAIFGLFVACLVGSTLSFLAIHRVLKVRHRIEVIPFFASNEAAGAQITYWIGRAQAMVRSGSPVPSATGILASPLPYFQLPGLADQSPELGEIEIAGVKVPTGELLRGLRQPRVRISGGWITDALNGSVFAEFQRRRGFSRYDSYGVIKHDFPIARQDQELELFAYHVIIKAVQVYAS